MNGSIRLIVGLGNPGRRYVGTWHNLGYMVVAELARRAGVGFRAGRGEFFHAAADFQSGGVTLMLPTSYMNRSGEPVGWWVRYHRLDPAEVLVVLDDHDLPLGRLRLREEGSSGGHRGLESIILALNSGAFPRLRVGIRTGGERDELAVQVLSKIPKSHRALVERVVAAAADAVETTLSQGVGAAMDEYNGLLID